MKNSKFRNLILVLFVFSIAEVSAGTYKIDGTFEGCQYGKLYPLVNRGILECQSYSYSYQYSPIVESDGRQVISIGGNQIDAIIHDGVTIRTRIDDEFEGCDFGKEIEFANQMVFICSEFKYKYSFRPEVLIFSFTTRSPKVYIDDEEFSGNLYYSRSQANQALADYAAKLRQQQEEELRRVQERLLLTQTEFEIVEKKRLEEEQRVENVKELRSQMEEELRQVEEQKELEFKKIEVAQLELLNVQSRIYETEEQLHRLLIEGLQQIEGDGQGRVSLTEVEDAENQQRIGDFEALSTQRVEQIRLLELEKQQLATKIRKRKQKENERITQLAIQEQEQREREEKEWIALIEQQRKLEEQEKQAALAEKKRQQEAAEKLAEKIQRERRLEKRAGEEFAKYIPEIRDKISENWIEPARSRNRRTILEVAINRQGEVIEVRVYSPSGSNSFDRSVITAIRKASPLPIPQYPELFKYFERFRFAFGSTSS